MFEIGGIDRINPAEHHRMNFLKSRQRLGAAMRGSVMRVADLDLAVGLLMLAMI